MAKVEIDERVLEIYTEATGVDYKYLEDMLIDKDRPGTSSMISMGGFKPVFLSLQYGEKVRWIGDPPMKQLLSWNIVK